MRKTFTVKFRRAISMLELVVVLGMTSAIFTAAFAIVAGLASGDQTSFSPAEQTRVILEASLRSDLKDAVECPLTGTTVTVGTFGQTASFPVVGDDGVLEVVTWHLNLDSESLIRSLYEADPNDCSPSGMPLTETVVVDRVRSASFTSEEGTALELSAQLAVGESSSRTLDLIVSS